MGHTMPRQYNLLWDVRGAVLAVRGHLLKRLLKTEPKGYHHDHFHHQDHHHQSNQHQNPKIPDARSGSSPSLPTKIHFMRSTHAKCSFVMLITLNITASTLPRPFRVGRAVRWRFGNGTGVAMEMVVVWTLCRTHTCSPIVRVCDVCNACAEPDGHGNADRARSSPARLRTSH